MYIAYFRNLLESSVKMAHKTNKMDTLGFSKAMIGPHSPIVKLGAEATICLQENGQARARFSIKGFENTKRYLI